MVAMIAKSSILHLLCRWKHFGLLSHLYFQCSTVSFSVLEPALFKPRRVLILTKLSRYDFEKRRKPELTEKQLELSLQQRGSDYNNLLYHHYIHKGVENTVNHAFSSAGIETKVVDRFDYTNQNIDWADIVVTTGGDGTYLLAASRILSREKPLIGFNSDPTRSRGYLCLPHKYSVDVKEAIDKIVNGKFYWTFRSRIRVMLIGENIFQTPVELHVQQLQQLENRYLDMEPREPKSPVGNIGVHEDSKLPCHVLPILALNEVFVGECISARMSYLELSLDGEKSYKLKCSGFIAATGTGSSSWVFNINKLTEQTMEEILTIVKEETNLPLQDADPNFVRKITNKFNEMLITEPDVPRMVYTIRDQQILSDARYNCLKPRGRARRVELKSRCFDASLVIDGGMSYAFNDGTRAVLELNSQDSLRTLTLVEKPLQVTFKH